MRAEERLKQITAGEIAVGHSAASPVAPGAARPADATPDTQTVVWCADANANRCGDERNKSTIAITWTR